VDQWQDADRAFVCVAGQTTASPREVTTAGSLAQRQ
jgi:hypothetical protein